jgi:hypothetical protein
MPVIGGLASGELGGVGGTTGGGGGGAVNSVSAGDASVIIAPVTGAVVVTTGTLDQIANLHIAAANWTNGGFKITSLANGTAATDAAAFGQIPTATNLPFTVNVISTSQTANANQVYVCTATLTLTLPGSPTTGQWVIIKMKSASTVTIGGTIDGTLNPTITTQYVSQTVVWDGAAWNNI